VPERDVVVLGHENDHDVRPAVERHITDVTPLSLPPELLANVRGLAHLLEERQQAENR
jgi:hypothetical protein